MGPDFQNKGKQFCSDVYLLYSWSLSSCSDYAGSLLHMENVLRETKIPLTHIEIQTASPLCGVFSSSELGLLHKHPTLAYFCAYTVNTSLCDLDVKVLLMQKQKVSSSCKEELER